MAVKLRLKRFGRNHSPFYRLGVMDERKPRDGRVIEELGLYDPKNRDASKQVRLNLDRIQYWLGVGAVASPTVRQLLKKHGVKAR
jgi:small subunit ribosomal protein S16